MKLSQVIAQLLEAKERVGDVELHVRKKGQKHVIEEVDVFLGDTLVTYLADLPTDRRTP